MSLEEAIQKNTKAVEKLTEALTQYVASGNGAAAPTVEAKQEKPAAKKEPKEKKSEKEDAPAPESEKYLEQVKPATRDAIKALGREKVTEILQEFHSTAKSAKDLFESQYDAYVARIKEVMEEDLT